MASLLWEKARLLLQGGGVRSMSLSASGVFTDSSTENILRKESEDMFR